MDSHTVDVNPDCPGSSAACFDGPNLIRLRSGDTRGCIECGAGRSVGFSIMVQFDDFSCREVGCGEFGESHHQHGTDCKVGDDQAARDLPTPEGRHLGDSIFIEP